MERATILFGSTTFVLLLLLFVHFVISRASPIGSKADQSALIALKSYISFSSNNAFLKSNWTAESSVCSWIGVLCSSSSNRVISLDISSMNLTGSIPPDIGNLSLLQFLDLSRNFLHGNLPKDLAKLPELRYLDLSRNNFSGEIVPSIFSTLSNLQFLILESNEFSGSIPGEIGDLRFLRVLDLANNQLSGPVPPGIFKLSLLERLDFTSNNLSGNLPTDIGFNLPMLEGLYISENQFDGPIPASLGKCSQLQYLSLSYNAFSGVIPREIGNLSQLEGIWLGDNKMTGRIPAEVGKLSRLKVFSAYENSLSGSIPASIFNITTLTVLLCALNNLSGNLPPNIGQGIPNLQNLNLGYNSLSGTIPPQICNASKLTFLSLASNSFTGFLPETLGNLRSLEVLALSDNALKSKFPSSDLNIFTSLTNCRNLTKLSIGTNPLSGLVLPASIGNLSNHLQHFDVRESEISSDIPAEIGNLTSLSWLNLCNNELTGPIPRIIGSLRSLQELFLQYNQLEGSIPDAICNLPNLGFIDLSTNRISGIVPSCIGNNTFLRYLHLDSNLFSSSLPPSLWTLTDLLMFTASSNSLSGFLPPEIGNLLAITTLDFSKNNFSGNIPITVGTLQNLFQLSLAENELEGPIPDTFSQALSLEMLDLSYNKLTGGIPQTLEDLVYLKIFNISFNQLSGKIPGGGPFQNFTASSFSSNAALCGDPRFEVPPCAMFQASKRSQSFRTPIFFTIITLVIISICSAFMLMRCRIRKRVDPENALSPSLITEGISYNEIQSITDGFSEGNLLAQGSSSSIYKAKLSDGTHVAVKVFNFKTPRTLKIFQTEWHLLSNLRHRNLIELITSCATRDQYFGALVLEEMPNGSLDRWLYSHNYCLGILQRLDIMIDVASALDYLHNDYYSPVVHCDVKPSNVLMDEDMVGHLCDFGIAKLLNVRNGNLRTKSIGTVGYIAPEYGNEGLVSTKCDVYSYGIMLMETFSRKRPSDDMFTGDITLRSWIRDSFPDAVLQVVDCNLLKQEETNFEAKMQCLSSIMELALKCTASSPEARTSIHDVLPALKRLRSQLVLAVTEGEVDLKVKSMNAASFS